MKKLPEEWLKTPAFKNIKLFDKDGWDKVTNAKKWNEAITRKEFIYRLSRTNCVHIKPNTLY